MIFSPNKKTITQDPDIRINNIKISRVTESKFLGIMIEENLSWKNHIQMLSTKLAKSVGILNLARKTLDKDTLKMLYYAFIYPLLLYGNIIWGNAPKSTIWPIFRLQKYAIRLITNLRRRDSTNSTFIELNLLKLPDLYDLSVGTFMLKFTQGKLPDIMSTFFQDAHSMHKHETRNKLIYRYPKYNTKIGQLFIKKTGIDVWNRITTSAGESPFSISQVKRIIVNYSIQSYKS